MNRNIKSSIYFLLPLLIIYFSFSLSSFSQQERTEAITDKQIEDVIDVALDLEGEASFVEIDDSNLITSINGQVTITAWIKPTKTPNRYFPIITKCDERTPGITNRSFVLSLREDGAVQFASSPDGQNEKYIFSPSGAITINQWHHVAGVIDTTINTISVYVDGIEAGFRDFGRNKRFYESTMPMRIGYSHEEINVSHSPFAGQIDEVSLWNVALTEEQIQNAMHNQLNGTEKGLVGYWKFDEQKNGIISDLTQNNLNGKLIDDARLVEYVRPIPIGIGIGELEKFAGIFEKALERGTNSYELYSSLAEIYVKLDRISDAEAVYLRALEADLRPSEHGDALKSLWKYYNESGREKAFIELLEKLKANVEENAVLYELLGDAYTKIGDKQKAEDAYSQWISLEKDKVLMQNQAQAQYELADKLLQRNILPETALELLLRAAETEWDRDLMLALAHAYVANEQYDNAFQLIKNIYDTGFFPLLNGDY